MCPRIGIRLLKVLLRRKISFRIQHHMCKGLRVRGEIQEVLRRHMPGKDLRTEGAEVHQACHVATAMGFKKFSARWTTHQSLRAIAATSVMHMPRRTAHAEKSRPAVHKCKLIWSLSCTLSRILEFCLRFFCGWRPARRGTATGRDHCGCSEEGLR